MEIGITTKQNFGLASTRKNKNQACYCLNTDLVWIENDSYSNEEKME